MSSYLDSSFLFSGCNFSYSSYDFVCASIYIRKPENDAVRKASQKASIFCLCDCVTGRKEK